MAANGLNKSTQEASPNGSDLEWSGKVMSGVWPSEKGEEGVQRGRKGIYLY